MNKVAFLLRYEGRESGFCVFSLPDGRRMMLPADFVPSPLVRGAQIALHMEQTESMPAVEVGEAKQELNALIHGTVLAAA